MLTCRPATPDDAQEIVSLIGELAAYEREPDAATATPEVIVAQLRADDPPFECLMAEVDGAVAGFALFFRNYSTWRARSGLYLEDLFVRPAYRGRGIARALLTCMASIALERGHARMEWAVLDWNDLGAEFYRRLGARPMTDWILWRIDGDALRDLAQQE